MDGQMRITVLGSSGQIGAYLSEYLSRKGHIVREFDIVNGIHQDMTHIPNTYLRNAIMESDFVFFLAFDVGGSRYLKKYQHTFDFVNNNTRLMANAFGLLEQYDKPFIFASSQMSNMSYSPYGTLKRLGELYTESLGGLVVKFWNVYGIEKDHKKAHVITDFIRKGFEDGDFEMLTDGEEVRQFLYAEDCCEGLEAVMKNYDEFYANDPLHITNFDYTTIREVAIIIENEFRLIGKPVNIIPGKASDTVQLDKRNEADPFIRKYWSPKTDLVTGISKVFEAMKKDYD
jgi:nucleoside-diphosphate-sugar epimerase